MAPARPAGPVAGAGVDEILKRLDALLPTELAVADQKRLLSDGIRLAALLGRLDDVRRLLALLQRIEPSTTAGAEDLFQRAFRLYQIGGKENLVESARLLELQGAAYLESSVRRRAIYWAARARGKAGDSASARVLFASLIAGPAVDLYGRWAAAAVGTPAQSPPAPAPVQSLAMAPEGMPPLSSVDAGPVERELLTIGLADAAEEAAELSGRVDPVFLAACASERREFRRTVSLLKSRFPQLGTPAEEAVPLAVRKLYYPVVQSAAIASEAGSHDLPVSLVYGLIRQESIFEAQIKSHAGAVGLMQVMPATGRHLFLRANRHGIPDLSDPGVNVQLGTLYISDMLRLFGGDLIAALAAYNAGPGRVLRWRREMKQLDMDEFVESIPLSEPRDYVKRVLFFKSVYGALYGPPSSVQVEEGNRPRLQLKLAPL